VCEHASKYPITHTTPLAKPPPGKIDPSLSCTTVPLNSAHSTQQPRPLLSANGDELSDAAIAVGDPFATFSRVRCVMAEWQAGEQCKIRHKTLKHGEIGRLAGGGMRLLGVAAHEPPMTTQLRGALFRCGGGKGGDTLDA
jgi:hypothetical protein